jgi:hemerythrin-like domain-containing protein
MCEYCGCQAVTAIGDLTREHDHVVGLIGTARAGCAAADTARLAEVARQIARVLGPHTEVEEHGLFPCLVEDFPEQVAALEAEHRGIEEALRVAAGGDPGGLLAALDILRDHILKEQDGVFPAALANLRTADWESIEAVRARVGSLLPAPHSVSERRPDIARPA